MKKFEEEVKRPTTTSLRPLTYRDNILKELSNVVKANYTKNAQILREHKEYIDFLEKRLKECEDLRIEANNEAAKEYALKCEVVEERATLRREIEKLKSQLNSQRPEISKLKSEIDWLHGLLDGRNEEVVQTVKTLNEAMPEIPEVPQFVADWYEENKGSLEYNIWKYIRDWKEQEEDEFYKFINSNILNPIETIFAMKNGYTVTKEKRFYLKNKLTGLYLRSYTGMSMDDTTLRFEEVSDNRACGFGGGTQFTQQEIDSMETGSYEQIGVEEV